MGDAYPSPEPQMMLERGDRWLAARDYSRAREEFSALTGKLVGTPREIAKSAWEWSTTNKELMPAPTST